VGNLIWVLLEIYSPLQVWKNFANRPRIDKVIVMDRVAPFFLTHSVYIIISSSQEWLTIADVCRLHEILFIHSTQCYENPLLCNYFKFFFTPIQYYWMGSHLPLMHFKSQYSTIHRKGWLLEWIFISGYQTTEKDSQTMQSRVNSSCFTTYCYFSAQTTWTMSINTAMILYQHRKPQNLS